MHHNQLSDKVLRFTRTLIHPDLSLVAGVSGGGDSVALLYLLSEHKKSLGIREIIVAHINHGLRGEESDQDEALVRTHAEQLGFRCYCKRLNNLQMDSPGLEASARVERYRFFHEIRRAAGNGRIATGHTLDDQTETVMMRIIRGCGTEGLCGIAPQRTDGVVRPLLETSRAELVAWLRERNITYRTDSSNADLRFLRNRVRGVVLPRLEQLSPGISLKFAALATEAQVQWSMQRQCVEQWLKHYRRSPCKGWFSIAVEGLDEEYLAVEGIRATFKEAGIILYQNHVSGIVSRRNPGCGNIFLLPGGWRYRWCNDRIVFQREVPCFNVPVTVPGSCENPYSGERLSLCYEQTVPASLDHGKWTVFIDGGDIGSACSYRTVTKDDEFIPFGTGRTVNVLKFLAKQGIPQVLREQTGCLVNGKNKIIWIPGIRIEERFRVTSATKKVIKVQSKSISYYNNVF